MEIVTIYQPTSILTVSWEHPVITASWMNADTEHIDLVGEGFYGPHAWGQSVNSISGNILFLPQQVLLIPGSRKLILKCVFSIVCTNLSWIMFRKVPLWFKSVLFHCNEEWSSSYPLFQLLMRIRGMTSGKPLSFKQQIKKIQINSNKSVCKECFPLLLCLADLY